MIKFIIARGIGFSPGSVKYIITMGFSIGTANVTYSSRRTGRGKPR